MRLNKYIASAGLCSRRKADEMINEGRVKVNGLEVTEHGFQVEEGSVVEVDGQVVTVSTKPPVYLMMNKPVGYITTVTDDRGRPTVMELVEHMEERLFPVGRLDYNTSGLLILTNDGDFANLMMHPGHKIYKTYRARVRGVVPLHKLNILRKGVYLDGVRTAPALAEIEKHGKGSTVLEIKIYEGKNRQIRRMCEAIGHPVLELERVAIGDLTLGHLKTGHTKKINPSDIQALVNLANKSEKAMDAARGKTGKPGRAGWARAKRK
ncbi:MAG: rRNA pseudouridine synthase [Firmicutes bacterium]|nr:rRNA pseudouridine synthase [Bacillota bacterium]